MKWKRWSVSGVSILFVSCVELVVRKIQIYFCARREYIVRSCNKNGVCRGASANMHPNYEGGMTMIIVMSWKLTGFRFRNLVYSGTRNFASPMQLIKLRRLRQDGVLMILLWWKETSLSYRWIQCRWNMGTTIGLGYENPEKPPIVKIGFSEETIDATRVRENEEIVHVYGTRRVVGAHLSVREGRLGVFRRLSWPC